MWLNALQPNFGEHLQKDSVEWISVLAIFGIHGVVDISFGSRSNGQGEDARHQISRQAVTNASQCIWMHLHHSGSSMHLPVVSKNLFQSILSWSFWEMFLCFQEMWISIFIEIHFYHNSDSMEKKLHRFWTLLGPTRGLYFFAGLQMFLSLVVIGMAVSFFFFEY